MTARRFDLVIFDLDGTLVDSLADIKGALDAVLTGRGFREVALADVRAMVGDGVAALVRRALVHSGQPAPDAQVAELAREMAEYYSRHPCVYTVPFPGVVAALDRLAALDCKLAVLTNKPGSVARALLSELRLLDHFVAVIGDQDGVARKPAPDGAWELVRRARTTHARTLMVGDGVPDVEVGHAAGLSTAAAGWGYTDRARLRALSPTYFLEVPDDLLTAVALAQD